MSNQYTKLPDPTGLKDQQTVQITGPDGLLSGYQYDQQTRTFYVTPLGAYPPVRSPFLPFGQQAKSRA